MESSGCVTLTLRAEQSILALYTDDEKDEESRTRSVFLCPISVSGANVYALVDNLTFVLAFSISEEVDINDLRRFMIRSYCFKYHNDAFNGGGDDTSVSAELRASLRSITTRDANRYEAWQEAVRRKQYRDADDNHEEEAEQEPEMFIRNMQQYALPGKAFRGDRQYRVTLDNHHVVDHFVNRFRYDITIRDFAYPVRLLDPLSITRGTDATLWPTGKDTVREEYVEKQCRWWYDKPLSFASSNVVRDGLLWSGALPGQKLEQHLAHGEAGDLANAGVSSLGEQRGRYRLRVRYLTQFLRVSNLTLYGVDFSQRRHELMREVMTATTGEHRKTPTTVVGEEEKKNRKRVNRIDAYFQSCNKRAKIDA